MPLNEWSPLLTFLGGVIAALVSWLVKRTPEKKNPVDSWMDQVTFLFGQVEKLQQQVHSTQEDNSNLRVEVSRSKESIADLQRQINEVVTERRALVVHAVSLSDQVTGLGGIPAPPPASVAHLFGS